MQRSIITMDSLLWQPGATVKHLPPLDHSLELMPDNADTWLAKGETLFRLEKFDEAVTAFDKTLTLNPREAHAAFGGAWHSLYSAMTRTQ